MRSADTGELRLVVCPRMWGLTYLCVTQCLSSVRVQRARSAFPALWSALQSEGCITSVAVTQLLAWVTKETRLPLVSDCRGACLRLLQACGDIHSDFKVNLLRKEGPDSF